MSRNRISPPRISTDRHPLLFALFCRTRAVSTGTMLCGGQMLIRLYSLLQRALSPNCLLLPTSASALTTAHARSPRHASSALCTPMLDLFLCLALEFQRTHEQLFNASHRGSWGTKTTHTQTRTHQHTNNHTRVHARTHMNIHART